MAFTSVTENLLKYKMGTIKQKINGNHMHNNLRKKEPKQKLITEKKIVHKVERMFVE